MCREELVCAEAIGLCAGGSAEVIRGHIIFIRGFAASKRGRLSESNR